MELLQYWKIARKWWWLILLSTILFGLVGIFYAQRQTPIYSTTTTLVINPSASNEMAYYSIDYTAQSLASTYSELMRTRSYGQLVTDAIGGTLSPDAIIGALSSRYVEGTQIFRISATYSDPVMAQTLSNTAAQVLIDANIARQRSQQEQLQNQRSTEAAQELQRLMELQSVLQQEADNYNKRIQNLENDIKNQENKPRSEEGDKLILQLKEELVTARSERIDVLSSLSDTQASLATSTNTGPINMDTAVVIDEAPLPAAPQPGQTRQLIILAFLGGLMAGAGLAWLLEYIDYTVRTPEELDTHYGVPSQGAIGMLSGRSAHDRAAGLVTLLEPRSPIAEAFRALRTAVRMANAVKPIRRLMVTSSGPGEGKTFVATNLAVSLAQEGKRVILVDADLRRPQVHKVFELSTEPGFTNLAIDPTLPLEQVLKPTATPTLRILTCGTIPPNPAELLGSVRAAELLQQLDAVADIVVFDTPPAATVTDAVILAAQVDGVLQVVRAGTTRIDLIQRCKVLLERTNVYILGPVLNGVRANDLGYYANYYYYGGYYQGDDGSKKSGERRGWGARRRRHTRPAAEAPLPQPATVAYPDQGQWTLLDEQKAPVKPQGKTANAPGRAGITALNGLHRVEEESQ